MKKTLLTLFALTTVATLQAKELTTEQDYIAQIQELQEQLKEYTTGFKPSLETRTELRLYGEETDSKGEHTRLENRLILNATEKTSLDLRIRNYGAMDTERKTPSGNEVRARFYYDHNDIFTSRLQYQTKKTNEHSFQYQPRINMLNLFNVDSQLLTKMVFAPSLQHVQKDHKYYNQANLDFEFFGNLPLGFEWEVNTYLGNKKAQDNTKLFGIKDSDDKAEYLEEQQTIALEFYLYKNIPLYKNDSFTMTLINEFGYEYSRNLKDTMSKVGSDKYNDYYEKDDSTEKFVYLENMIQIDKNINNNIDVFGGVGIRTANFDNRTKVSDFTTQPQAYIGFTTKF